MVEALAKSESSVGLALWGILTEQNLELLKKYDMRCESFGRHQMMLHVSKDHPFAKLSEEEVGMLRDEQFVIFSKKFWRATNSAIKARREAYLIEDRDVVKFMIAENKAVSIMPDTFSYKDINYESGNIVMMPLKAGSAISLSTVPWNGNALVILQSYTQSTGNTINFAHYLAYTIPVGLISIAGFLLLCKFVFRLDVSRLQNLDPGVFGEKDAKLNTERKIALAALAILILMIVVPGLMPKTSLIGILGTKTGLSLKAMLVFAVLSLIRINGEQIFNFAKLAAKGIPWNMIMMTVGIFCFVNFLSSQNAGIGAFLGKIFTPMFQGVSPVVFFILVTVVTVALTNVMINMVVAVIMISATVPVAASLGISADQVVYLITVSCTIAFLLPPASTASCVLFANTEWVRAKDVYTFAIPTVIMMAVVALGWNLILFMF